MADQVYPGRLTVIETSVKPGLIGFPETWATYAVVDDPDAVVRVRPLSADRLRQAYEER